MRVGVTGGTGFIGCHLAKRLVEAGHEVILTGRRSRTLPSPLSEESAVSVRRAAVTDQDAMVSAFARVQALVHLAGINYQRDRQSYDRVHCQGTEAVVAVADDVGMERLVLVSYLRARPNCGSPYLESKWHAEELVRAAETTAVILKPAAVFGRGDQLLTHLARWFHTAAVVPRTGIRDRPLRPVAVEDVVRTIHAGVTGTHHIGETVALLGPSSLTQTELMHRVGRAIGRRVVVVPTPVVLQRISAWAMERTLEPPIVTRAGVRMLAEGMTEPAPAGGCCRPVPNLRPQTAPTEAYIERAVESVDRYGTGDFRHV